MNQPLGIGIVDFARLPFVLNIQFLSPLQIVILKSINGESLNAAELNLHRKYTGKDHYLAQMVSNLNILTGRRSGKSTIIAVVACLFYATQLDWLPYLRTSPWASFVIISASKRQANEIFDAIVHMVKGSQYLLEEFLGGSMDGVKTNTIELTNRTRILVLPADHSLIRGFASPLVVLDENAFFGEDNDEIKNSDAAIEMAITPAMAQFGDMGRILKISTPNGERGIMYRDYKNRQHPDVLFFHATSQEMNPSLSQSFLDRERLKGESYFRREYLAEWTAAEASYFDPASIDAAILRGILKIPINDGIKYVAATDYATRNDRWAWCIAHREFKQNGHNSPTAKIVIDYLDYRQGQPGQELNPEEVTAQIANDLLHYGCTTLHGDQNAHAALVGYFRRSGIALKEFTFSNTSKQKIFTALQVAFNAGRIQIIDHPLAIKDLKDLRERRTRGNHIQISHADGCHDDFADVIAIVHFHLAQDMEFSHGLDASIESDERPPLETDNGVLLRAPDAAEFMNLFGR